MCRDFKSAWVGTGRFVECVVDADLLNKGNRKGPGTRNFVNLFYQD